MALRHRHGAGGRARAVGVHRHVRAGRGPDLPGDRARRGHGPDGELRAAGLRARDVHRGPARDPRDRPAPLRGLGARRLGAGGGHPVRGVLRELAARLRLLAAGSRRRGGVDPAPRLGDLAGRDRGLPGGLDARPAQAGPGHQPAQDGGGCAGPARGLGAGRAGRARVVLPGAVPGGRDRGRRAAGRGRPGRRSHGVRDQAQRRHHGGMLDRIDSLLVNTPVLFYYATYGRSLGA